MQKFLLGGVGALVVAAPAFLFAQQVPTSATYITDEQVKAVNAQPGTDRTLQVFDLGKTAMSVGIASWRSETRPAGCVPSRAWESRPRFKPGPQPPT